MIRIRYKGRRRYPALLVELPAAAQTRGPLQLVMESLVGEAETGFAPRVGLVISCDKAISLFLTWLYGAKSFK
jgi:hypothetical protein